MRCETVLVRLRSLANPANVAGMARYGINPEGTLGISIPVLRKMAKEIGTDHGLAQKLWSSGVHEARILAAFIDDPVQVDEEQMDRWVLELDSWDVCDQVCANLFDRVEIASQKAVEWARRQETFVKRAGFALMAALAWHDKKAPDEVFEAFLPVILAQATEERNYVKKAVNWALRQIGKRNLSLNRLAIETARRIQALDSKSARWVASDALRELTGDKVQDKIGAG